MHNNKDLGIHIKMTTNTRGIICDTYIFNMTYLSLWNYILLSMTELVHAIGWGCYNKLMDGQKIPDMGGSNVKETRLADTKSCMHDI